MKIVILIIILVVLALWLSSRSPKKENFENVYALNPAVAKANDNKLGLVLTELKNQANDAGVVQALAANGNGGYFPTTTDTKLFDLWYEFIDKVPANVRESFYNLFPALMPRVNLKLFGYTKAMNDTLRLLKPLLIHPEELKTYEDVLKRFQDSAVNIESGFTGVTFTPSALNAAEKSFFTQS